MNLLESIYRWRHCRRERLNAIPFEELQICHSRDPKDTYEEFIRRLSWLVLYAAADYARRVEPAGAQRERVESTVMRIFQEFSPEFASGASSTVLRRFANVIRRVLDDEAFQQIGSIYYKLLPVYHIPDDEERRLIAAAFQEGLSQTEGNSFAEALATRFGVTVDRIQTILLRANRSLAKVIQEEFELGELAQLTEGYLPGEV